MEVVCKIGKAYYDDWFGYTLELSPFRSVHPNPELSRIEGCHLINESRYLNRYEDMDVRALKINAGDVRYLPVGFHLRFSSLSSLEIKDCNLKEISRRDLNGLKKLRAISITGCLLTKLPDDLFIDFSQLKSVNLSNNKIESASSKLLQPFILRVMIRIDLRGNKTINAHYSQDEGSVESLQELMKIIDEKCGAQENCEIVEKKNEPSPFEAKIRSLWPSGRFSDFEVKAGLKTFRVHRNVLGLQSSVFAKVFDDNRQATDLKIPDFSETAVENLLHFMYTDEIKKDSDGIEMFSIASKLEVPELKKIYEKRLIKTLENCDALTAYEIFLCAHQNSSAELKLQAFKAISTFIGTALPASLKDDPERLKTLIEKKVEFNQMLKNFEL